MLKYTVMCFPIPVISVQNSGLALVQGVRVYEPRSITTIGTTIETKLGIHPATNYLILNFYPAAP